MRRSSDNPNAVPVFFPGTKRYLFNVDGVLTSDSRNQAVSESNGNAWSVVHMNEFAPQLFR